MIIIVGSPWQAIISKSYLRKENISQYKLIIERSSNKSYYEILRIFGIGEESEKILFVFHWSVYTPLNFQKIFSLKKNIELLKQKLTYQITDHDKEIIVFSENNMLFQLFIKVFHDKYIIKLEDGVLDYLDDLKKDSIFKGLTKKILFGRNAELFSYKNFYEKFDKIVMLAKKYEEWSEKYTSLLIYKTEIIQTINEVYSNIANADYNSVSLLLTQSLSEDQVISEKDELIIYETILKKLKRKTLIKPHPRSSNSKLRELESLANKYNAEFIFDFGVPAEALLVKNKYHSVIGVYSNTIIYSKLLFDIDSYTTLDDYMINKSQKKSKRTLRYIKNQIEKYFDIKNVTDLFLQQ
jgi:hypothetical protein